jgi:hypothetical protein
MISEFSFEAKSSCTFVHRAGIKSIAYVNALHVFEAITFLCVGRIAELALKRFLETNCFLYFKIGWSQACCFYLTSVNSDVSFQRIKCVELFMAKVTIMISLH